MTTLIEILYNYAQAYAPAFLVGGEHEDLGKIVDEQKKRIAALLPPRGRPGLG